MPACCAASPPPAPSALPSLCSLPPRHFAPRRPPRPNTCPPIPKASLRWRGPYNSLDAAGLAPWELKATVQLFDERGGLPQTFSFDEIWAGPNLYRETWTSASFEQTTVVNQDGTFRSGSQRSVPVLVISALRTILHPVPDPSVTESATLTLQAEKFGKGRFNCVDSIPSTAGTGPRAAGCPHHPPPHPVLLRPRHPDLPLHPQERLRDRRPTPACSSRAGMSPRKPTSSFGKVTRAKATVNSLRQVPQPDPTSLRPTRRRNPSGLGHPKR